VPKRSARRNRPSRQPPWAPRAAEPAPEARPAPPQRPTPERWAGQALLPLRLFLGATFVYAGLQKLSDSGFLSAEGSTYIGRQLEGYAPRSPLGGLLTWLGQNAAIEVGLSVILVEVTVGVAVLAGYRIRAASAVAASLSFILFLSASWYVQPYFLGSDSIYTVAWITLALTGDKGRGVVARRAPRGNPATAFDPGRRRLLLQLGGGAVALVWVLGLVPRGRPGTASTAGVPATPSATPGAPSGSPGPPSASPGESASPSASAAAPAGRPIGSLAQLRSQGSLAYQDPRSGDPAIAVALNGGSVVAYDAVCTHAGCTVEYDPSQQVLICPCHGAAFDPAHQAAVVDGPAPTPLPGLQVTVGSDGNIYAAQ